MLDYDDLFEIVGKIIYEDKGEEQTSVMINQYDTSERMTDGMDAGFRFALQVKRWRKDTVTGEWGYGYGGEYLLPVDVTEQQVVFKAFSAILHFEEHETRERFTYEGVSVMGPHPNLHMLLRTQSGEFSASL